MAEQRTSLVTTSSVTFTTTGKSRFTVSGTIHTRLPVRSTWFSRFDSRPARLKQLGPDLWPPLRRVPIHDPTASAEYIHQPRLCTQDFVGSFLEGGHDGQQDFVFQHQE